MKHIKRFESYSQRGKEINHLSELKEGDMVSFQGSRHEVVEVDEYRAVLRSLKTDRETKVNQGQLEQYGITVFN